MLEKPMTASCILPSRSGTITATMRAPKLVTQTSTPFLFFSMYRSVFLPVNSDWKSVLLRTGFAFSAQAVSKNRPATNRHDLILFIVDIVLIDFILSALHLH